MHVYQDVWAAMHLNTTVPGYLDGSGSNSINQAAPLFVPRNGELCLGEKSCVAAQAEVMRFSGLGTAAIPIWLAGTYLIANILLNTLNFYWYGRMIKTVMKRFSEAPSKGAESKRRPSVLLEVVDGLEQDDRMHGSMVFEEKGKSTGVEDDDGVKKR